MYTNPEEFGEEIAHKFRLLIEHLDQDVFCKTRLSGFDLPLCPVIVAESPDDLLPMELMNVATLFSYKHDGPVLVWGNFPFQNAYFIWTSAIAGLVCALQRGVVQGARMFSQSAFERKLAITAMLVVRKRVSCYKAHALSFRYYGINDLPTSMRGELFTDNFLKESFAQKDIDSVDQLVLFRLLSVAVPKDGSWEDYISPLVVDLLINHNS